MWTTAVLRFATLGLLLTMATSQNTYITDLIVLEGKESSEPYGYSMIPIDLNEDTDTKGMTLYFATRNGTNSQDAIRDIKMVNGSSRDVPVPQGYVKNAMDLNAGAKGDYIFATYTREASKGDPIIGFSVISCKENNETCQCSDSKAIKDPIDLNRGSGGKYIYACILRLASRNEIGNNVDTA